VHQQINANGNMVKSPNLVDFNETQYMLTAARDKDAYKRNAFNQEVSDKLASDRPLPDSRSRE